MPKLNLLILDAGVVIQLHELNLWEKIAEACDLHLSKIVIQEAAFHSLEDHPPNGLPIDLSSDIDAGRVTVFERSPSQMQAFCCQFDQNYMCDLDDGEAESLAYLFSKADDYLICSGDAIVYRVLGNTSRGEQGISLEEILAKTGFTKDVSWPYDKKFRVQHSDQGGIDLIQNRGRL